MCAAIATPPGSAWGPMPNPPLHKSKITKRPCFTEWSKIDAMLDAEVERAVCFYRKRIAELPR